MKCRIGKSEHIRKNGMRRGKHPRQSLQRGEPAQRAVSQNHVCVDCGRQFVNNPKNHRGYSDGIRKICFKMYLNGMGFRGIERGRAEIRVK